MKKWKKKEGCWRNEKTGEELIVGEEYIPMIDKPTGRYQIDLLTEFSPVSYSPPDLIRFHNSLTDAKKELERWVKKENKR